MNKFIGIATNRLRNKLSEKKAFYEIQDFESAGFPPVVLDAIEQALINRLHRDLDMPLTEWASLDCEPVLEAWDGFLEAAERQLRLPEYKLNAVIKAVVNRLFPLLVWPRTQIPKFIFGDHEEMERDDIARQVDKLPVNQQLGSAVMRYMNKKNLDQLSREKCKEVISKIDAKLTERYDEQKWFESVRPLFELADGSVPTDLLASYFFHRGQRGWSNKLADIADQITKSEFRQWIKDEEIAVEDSTNHPSTAGRGEADIDRSNDSNSDKSGINAQFESREGEKRENADSNVSSASVQSVNQEKPAIESEYEEAADTDSEEDEPIWRKFIGSANDGSEVSDQNDALKEQEGTSNESAEKSAGYQLNEVFKEDNGDLDNEAAQELNRHLKGRREYFIREIFRGSLSAYEQAVRKLSDCKDWEEAYPYIDREIFDRNDIDLYSKPAVDFTDAMQDYFENYR